MPTTAQTANFDRAFIDRLLGLLPYVVVFLLALTHPIDLDLGWHLKYGEYIFTNHALLQENIFSSAMPGYRYLNHSWASELILYTVFRSGGFLGISLLGATLMTMTFFFLAQAANLDNWGKSILFPTMLFLLDGVIEQSFRSQYFSFLGIAILLYLLGRLEREPRRTALAISLLFLLWVNLHGQFIMGLGIFVIWLICYFTGTTEWESPTAGRRLPPLFLAILLLTVLAATLLNPYGTELYLEIFRHFGNPLQRSIQEWQPIYHDTGLLINFLAWSGFLLLSVIIGRQWQDLPRHGQYLGPLLLMFIAAIDQRRYFWPMIMLSVPATLPILNRLKPAGKYLGNAICFSILMTVYLFNASERLPAWRPFSFDWNTYCRYNSFSPRSAEFLKKIAPGHKILTDYDLGGWLIWNYPDLKPTIDGRMPFWRDDKGYSAYQEYLALEQGRADIDASPYDLVYWPPHKAALYDQLTTLTASGKWLHIYDDPFISIFVRNSRREKRDILGGGKDD